MAREILGLGDKPDRKLLGAFPEFFSLSPLILIDYREAPTSTTVRLGMGTGILMLQYGSICLS
jgi:hypothetical protein